MSRSLTPSHLIILSIIMSHASWFLLKTWQKGTLCEKLDKKCALCMLQTRRDCMTCYNWCLVNAGITHIAFNAANTTKMSTFQKFLFCILHSALCVVRKNRQWTKWSMLGVCTRTLLKVGTVHCAFIYLINVLNRILYFALQFSVSTFWRLQCLDAWQYWWRRNILFLTKSMIFLLNWDNCYTESIKEAWRTDYLCISYF